MGRNCQLIHCQAQNGQINFGNFIYRKLDGKGCNGLVYLRYIIDNVLRQVVWVR